jgi:hypothetical protein
MGSCGESAALVPRGFARAELSAAAKDQGTAGISRAMEYDFSRLERGRACGARSLISRLQADARHRSLTDGAAVAERRLLGR